MNKDELVDKLIGIYTDPNIPVTAAGGIFAFTYGEFVVDIYKPTELMSAASEKDSRVKKRYEAELGSALNMYRYFKAHPEQFAAFSGGKPSSSKKHVDDVYQLITYGAPGTGKSHGTEGLIEKYGIPSERVFRTTFHPDSDYSTFVGAYKPATDKGTQKIVYSFRPQAFINAYVKAWEDVSKPVVLVIEEINRGHCAQIFGDLFQLLDRRGDGYSRYPITPDADLAAWLDGKVPDATTLKLPPNLYIWATMNTSDQSLFPMDSAFKRRWDWEYVPIAKPDKDDDANWRDRAILANGMYYDWWTFITIVNKHIAKTTQSEDKQLGYFFVKAPDDTGVIAADRFVNKVLFFLFNDAFKDWKLPEGVFGKGNNERYAFKDFFYCEKTDGHKSGDVREDVLAEFLDHLQWENEKLTASNDAPKTNGEKAQSAATAQPSAPAQASSVGQAAVVNQSVASAE